MRFLGILVILMQISLFAEGKQSDLQRLMDGNQRFASGNSIHPNRSEERRKEIAELQEPFATIVACSDSRVAPEVIFDQGLGDLFVVRDAGNVIGPVEQDSIEYSVIYLHSTIIFVLGHENCGAVGAVMEGKTKDIEAVAELIQPAVDKSKKQNGNDLAAAIKTNVRLAVENLKKKQPLKEFIEKKKLTVVGGVYNFRTGKIEVLSD